MIVGRVVVEHGRASIEATKVPPRNVWPFDGEGLRLKLNFIVECATSNPYPELLGLRSAFWAFVDSTGEHTP